MTSKMATEEETATFRSFFKTYNALSETCFNACVWDFGTSVVRNRESRCVEKCANHYMQMTKVS